MSLAVLTDIDGTLTPARRALQSEMAEALKRLKVEFHVAAGSDLKLVEPQFLRPLWDFGFRRDFDAFVSNGATHLHCAFSRGFLVENVHDFHFRSHLGEANYQRLLDSIGGILSDPEFALPSTVVVIGEQIVDRDSMLNFAPIGRPKGELSEDAFANRKRFVEFDRSTEYRKRIRDRMVRELSSVISEKGLRIMFGGETSFDIVIEGNDKTKPVRALLDRGIREVVFLGDALFPGGNDSVISDFVTNWKGSGPCPLRPIQVADWKDTIRVMEREGWLS